MSQLDWCGDRYYWWAGYADCDRQKGHESLHGVVGTGLRWNDKGDRIVPPVPSVGAEAQDTPESLWGRTE